MAFAGMGKTQIRYDMFDMVKNAETAQTQAIKTPFALPSIAACSSWLVAHGRT